MQPLTTGLKQKLDYSDYAKIPPDRNRWGFLDGDPTSRLPRPPFHQRVSKRLQRQLEAYFEGRSLGEVFDAPRPRSDHEGPALRGARHHPLLARRP